MLSDLKYKPFPLEVCKKTKKRIPLHKICNKSLLEHNKKNKLKRNNYSDNSPGPFT